MTDRAALDKWIADSGLLLQEITGCDPSDGSEPSPDASPGSSNNEPGQR